MAKASVQVVGKNRPPRKAWGTVQKSATYRNAVALLDTGHEVKIRPNIEMLKRQGLQDPMNSFKVALRRYVRENHKSFRVYLSDGAIYIAKK